jgi:hypothetical protein
MSMKNSVMMLALGSAMISTPVLAQDGGRGGGFAQRDQTRAEAQRRAAMTMAGAARVACSG